MKFLISVINGESLKQSKEADDIIALDKENMLPILLESRTFFPEERRRNGLFHPSNRVVIAHYKNTVAGYFDYCNDWKDPEDLYLSSFQIRKSYRGGCLFKLLVSSLIDDLRYRNFRLIKTNVQKSNLKMLSIAQKFGFSIENNSDNSSTISMFAKKEILESQKILRLFGLN